MSKTCNIEFHPHTTRGDGDLNVYGSHINGKMGYSIFVRKAPFQEDNPRDSVIFSLTSDYSGELVTATFCVPPETMISIAESILKLARGESKLIIATKETP
jgi:hypothetical protein